MSKCIVVACETPDIWHEERRKGIGASEAAALFGESSYLTARMLWSRKKLGLADTVQETEAMAAGKFLEDGNARWYAHAHGRKIVRPQDFFGCPTAFAVVIRHPIYPLFVTPDRIIVDEPRGPGIWEGKNVSGWSADEWEDEAGATAPPLKHQIQVQVGLACTGMGWGALAAITGGNKRRDADVDRHDAFIAKLGAMATAFWASLSGDISPAPQAADLEDIKRQWPQSIEGLSYQHQDSEDFLELARLKAEASANEAAQEALMAKIGSLAGAAETITDQSGRKLATWKTSTRRDPPREAREVQVRTFRLDSSILKAAKAALPNGTQFPILPD